MHVFPNSSRISDLGKKLEDIDYNMQKGKHRQICFFYNIENSFNYYVQKILNTNNYYNIYTDYHYFDNSNSKGAENENIICPGKIYLLEPDEDITENLRLEFIKLQKRKNKN